MGLKDDWNKNSKMIKNGEYSLESDKLVNETGLGEGNTVVEIKDERQNQLLYKVADHPPVYLTIFCCLQHTLISLSGNMAISLLVADVTCATHLEDIKTTLLSSTLLMSGVVTVFMFLIGASMGQTSSTNEFINTGNINITSDSTNTGDITVGNITGNDIQLLSHERNEVSVIPSGKYATIPKASGFISVFLKNGEGESEKFDVAKYASESGRNFIVKDKSGKVNVCIAKHGTKLEVDCPLEKK